MTNDEKRKELEKWLKLLELRAENEFAQLRELMKTDLEQFQRDVKELENINLLLNQ